MAKRIYVGNLPFSATEADIRQLFAQHGSVSSVSLITDRETGRPRGFGFVEMDDAGAQAAIAALDGKDFGGRSLRVNEAQERGGRGGGGGGGGYGGGPRGGGGGYGGGPRGGGGGYGGGHGGGPRGGGGGGGYGAGGGGGYGGGGGGGYGGGGRDAGGSRDVGTPLGDPVLGGGRPDRGRDRGRDRDRDRERRRDHDDEN